MLQRRQFLQSAAASVSAAGLGGCDPLGLIAPTNNLDIQRAQYNVMPNLLTTDMVSLSADAAPPIAANMPHTQQVISECLEPIGCLIGW